MRGYGQISAGTGKGNIRAHRASWLIHKGPIPEGMHVLHRCDNTKCVNPSHLFLGTAEDNAKDREAKGRGNNPGQPPGEKHARARLTAAQVIDIRKRCAAGEKTKDIAARFGVTEGTIADIRNRRRWKHLP